jgi:hypothetical protein
MGRQIIQQIALIGFYRKVVMGPATDQVVCKLPLCKQRIGGDGFAFDRNGIQHRCSHLDFIGLLFSVGAF